MFVQKITPTLFLNILLTDASSFVLLRKSIMIPFPMPSDHSSPRLSSAERDQSRHIADHSSTLSLLGKWIVIAHFILLLALNANASVLDY